MPRISKAPPTDRPASRPGPWATATAIRRQAHDLLETAILSRGERARATDHRMILIGALIIILTMTMGLYLAVAGLYLAGELVFGPMVWLDGASNALYALLLLLLVLPLVGGTFRIAARMTAASLGTPAVLADTSSGDETPTVADIFYPFTSPVAYGRTMLVAGEALLWLLLILALPILLFRVSALPLLYLARTAPVLHGIATVARPVICLLIGAGMLLLSGPRAGLAYYVFTCPHMTVRDIARYLRSLRRPLLPILCLRLSFAGWTALSLVGIGLPLILHVGPLGLLTGAVYARTLSPDPIPSSTYRLENPT